MELNKKQSESIETSTFCTLFYLFLNRFLSINLHSLTSGQIPFHHSLCTETESRSPRNTCSVHKVGRPAKLNAQTRRDLVMEVTKNSTIHWKQSQKHIINQTFMVGWLVATLSKRKINFFMFAKWHLKDFQRMRKKMIRSDERKHVTPLAEVQTLCLVNQVLLIIWLIRSL